MRKVIYSKYNSLRRPEFRTATRILLDDGTKTVEKWPLCPEAASHIQRIKDNYARIENLYNRIRILPGEIRDGILSYPCLRGNTPLEAVDYSRDSLEDITRKLEKGLSLILDFNQDFKVPFALTEGFQAVFGPGAPSLEGTPAVRVCNFDSIFSNFIIQDGICYCIDYEWVFNFPVPISFLKFRTLSREYENHEPYLSRRFSREVFLAAFGFGPNACELYDPMEYAFQEYVHGKGVSYIYTARYEKASRSLDDYIRAQDELRAQLTLKEGHIRNLESLLKARDEKLSLDAQTLDSKEVHIGNLQDQVSSLTQLAANHESEITGLRQALMDKENHIKNLDDILDSQQGTIAQRDEALRESAVAIEDRDGIIKNREAIIDQKDALILSQDEAIRKAQEELSRKEEELSQTVSRMETELSQTVSRMKAELSQKEELLAQKDSLITQKDQELKKMESLIEDHTLRHQSRDALLSESEKACSLLKEKISALESQISADSDSLSSLQNALVYKDVHIRNLTAEIQALGETINMQSTHIDKLRRAIRNPLYGASWLAKRAAGKVSSSIKGRFSRRRTARERHEMEEQHSLLAPIKNERAEEYASWIAARERREAIASPVRKDFSYAPRISILVPVYNVLDKHLVPCIESVLSQTYENFELCLADDCSTWENVRKTLEAYKGNPKVKVVFRKENGHISECTNSALALAEGEFVGLLDCDDTLSPNALYEMVRLLNQDPSLDFIYSDEDKIDDDGKNRHMPHFKPDWSPDTLMSHMYTCHFTIYRKALVEEVGGLRTAFNGSQDYDLALRVAEKTTHIGHVPKILYHWRERSGSTSADLKAKPYVYEAARRAKEEALSRRGLSGSVIFDESTHQYNVIYDPPEDALVSIIIPSKDNPALLGRCLSTLKAKTAYKSYEVIVVDNGSSEENKEIISRLLAAYGAEYIYDPQPFNFSRMCNEGASHARGDYLLFLNDDIEIITEDWLSILLGQAALPHAGCVGAKLLYPGDFMMKRAASASSLEDSGASESRQESSDARASESGRENSDADASKSGQESSDARASEPGRGSSDADASKSGQESSDARASEPEREGEDASSQASGSSDAGDSLPSQDEPGEAPDDTASEKTALPRSPYGEGFGVIQHVGVINIENGPCHAFSGMSDEPVYYFGRNRLTYNVLAVTAACLLMKKAIFTEVGGFNEDLAVAYNDIDLCMKVCEAGYYNAVRPDAVLVHHESASRGNDALSLPKMRRLMAEQEDLYRRHPAFDRQDPFYNPNLAQNRVDFTCRFDTSFDKETAFRKISSLPGREGHPELRYAVDCASAQRFVLIEGWAFIPGSSKNSRSSLKLILQGEEGIYLAETAPVYRPDLEKAFPDEMDVLYSGFHARFHRDEIPDGEYSITLLWNDSARVDTEARLIK